MLKQDSYFAPPGCCFNCRGTAVPLVELDLLEDDLLMVNLPEDLRGHLFLCAHCCNEVVQIIGAMPAESATRLVAEKDRLEAEVAELRDEVARWSAMARSMARALPESEIDEVRQAREEALQP